MSKVLIVSAVCVVGILLAVLAYFYLPTPPIKTETKYKKELVVVGNNIPNLPKAQAGVCGPRGCGPNMSPREVVNLELTADQLTALVNSQKPADVLLSDIVIDIKDTKFLASAKSFYPQLPGNILIIGSTMPEPRVIAFKVSEVYQGNKKMPQETLNFVNPNGNDLFQKLLTKYDIWPSRMEITSNKFYIEANIPKGLIKIENGIVKLFQ